MFEPECEAIGVINRTEDNKHIMFLDYDYVHPTVIRKDLDFLVKAGMSNFFILETGPQKHHAVSFTKLPFRSMKELASHTHEDKRHYEIPETHSRRSTVLRISGKYKINSKDMVRHPPKFVAVYPRQPVNIESDISTAHYNLYKALFNLEHIKFINQDNFSNVEIVKFQTLIGGE